MMHEPILRLVKARLNRLADDTSLDEYLKKRIAGAIEELKRTGIHIQSTADDDMLLCDFVVWQYQNRDKPGDMPQWLIHKRRERFLQEFGGGNNAT